MAAARWVATRLQSDTEDTPDLLVRATFCHQSHDARLPVTQSLFFLHRPTRSKLEQQFK
jgi:hypothetical protein